MENMFTFNFVAPLLIGLAFLIAGYAVRQFLNSKMYNEQVDRYVKQVVKYVEQVASTKSSEEKLKIARDLLKKYFPKLTDENIDVIIESTVKEMNVAWQYLTKVQTPLSFPSSAVAPVHDAEFWRDHLEAQDHDYSNDKIDYVGGFSDADEGNDLEEESYPDYYNFGTKETWNEFDTLEETYDFICKMYFNSLPNKPLFTLIDDNGNVINSFFTAGELLNYVQSIYDELKPKEGADENS